MRNKLKKKRMHNEKCCFPQGKTWKWNKGGNNVYN